MIKKIVTGLIAGLILSVSYNGEAAAHVSVKPAEAETATYQVFTTSVPNEKDMPTTKVRLIVPSSLENVTPTVKPGWTIETVKSGSEAGATVEEITWSGGSIPAGQREEFSFSAKLPAQEASLKWKAYQMYESGEEVAWDQDPGKSGHGGDSSTPYSETRVVRELAAATALKESEKAANNRLTLAIGLSIVAIVLSVTALTQKR